MQRASADQAERVSDGGSGNFGHSGRPGQIGGSGKGGTRKIGEINPENMVVAIQHFGYQIRDRKAENIIAIDKKGNVHPEENGILLFGEEDFYFLREHQDIKELQCVNKEYTYRISVLKDMSKVVYNDIYKEGFKYMLDSDYEAQDAAMQVLQERGYVRYDKRRSEP